MTTLPHQGNALHQDAQAYEHLLHQIAQRRLDGMALLWLSGHQPLAFIAGQLCWLIAPLALLCGWSQVETWAAALSMPHSGARIVHDLHRLHAQTRDATPAAQAQGLSAPRLPNAPRAQHKE